MVNKIVENLRTKLINLIKNLSREKDLRKISSAALRFANQNEKLIKSFDNKKCKEGLVAVQIYGSRGITGKEIKHLRNDVFASLQRILEGLNEVILI